MAIVKMHQASDGSLHVTFEAFAAHEAVLKMTPQLEELADTIEFNDDINGSVIFAEDFPAFVIANADALRNILNGAVLTQRGRKEGAVAKVKKPLALVAASSIAA